MFLGPMQPLWRGNPLDEYIKPSLQVPPGIGKELPTAPENFSQVDKPTAPAFYLS